MIGLCGVVAIAEGVGLAQKVYRQVNAAYAWVDAKLNPAGPQPGILPSVDLFFVTEELAAQLDEAEYERTFLERLARLDDAKDCFNEIQDQVETDLWDSEVDYEPVEFSSCPKFMPLSNSAPALAPAYVPVKGKFLNPEPTDIHQEVEDKLAAIHGVTIPETADDLASVLDVPGAKALALAPVRRRALALAPVRRREAPVRLGPKQKARGMLRTRLALRSAGGRRWRSRM
ncbi:MAG: hypothetical protein HC852_11160 [Acaryochloridaceae cyanobacterium RU_4_10]|nr:hypothetical protein [Acaryochloridaceae cyanobacterium RU_4_10]